MSLLNGTLPKVQYERDVYSNNKSIQIKEYTTTIGEENDKKKEIKITIKTFNIEIENKIEAIIQTEDDCSNFEWLRLIYLVITKFDIAYNLKNTVYLNGIKEKNLKKHLEDIIRDIFPEAKHLVVLGSEFD